MSFRLPETQTLLYDAYVTIYVIRAGQYAKLGSSTDLARRLRQIQTRHPGCLYPEDLDPQVPAEIVARLGHGKWGVEGALHDAFADLHVRGEWFRYEERLQRWCERRPYVPGQPNSVEF